MSKETRQIDDNFPTLEIFAYCITCATLLIGAEKYDSFWGKKVTQIAQLHRRGTNHEVYIGKQKE
jgi:hypothetical protein